MTATHRRLAGLLTAVALATTAALVPASASAQAAYTGTHLHARMSSTSTYPHCYGGVWYESHHGWREFEITLHGISGLNGKRLTVRVHGDVVGQMLVHSGYAHMDRHTGLPTMAAGNWVRVRTGSGTLVSAGQLRSMHHHMM